MKSKTIYGEIRSIFVLLFLLVVTPLNSWAGEGEFHGPTWNGDNIASVGKIDIHVLVDADNTMTDAELENYFTRISEELYDATEKQVQLGIVKLYRGGPEGKEKADLLVSEKIPGAYTYAGNFGKSGLYAKIYLDTSDISSASSPVVVHEMGHLVFGIYDSYLGFLQNPNDQTQYLAPKNDNSGYEWRGSIFYWNPNKTPVPNPDYNNTFYDTTPFDVDSPACIMDGPFQGETEFSTTAGQGWATDHILPFEKDFSWSIAPDGSTLNPPFTARAKVVTKQNEKNINKSAWETIHEKFDSMKHPNTEPVSDISGHQPIDFRVVPLVNELSICLDKSGSMDGSPLSLAKTAAGIVIALTHQQYDIEEPDGKIKIPIAGDYLSVTSFNESSSVVYSDGGRVCEMTLVNKVSAAAAVMGIHSDGMTSIGAGLIRSIDTFNLDSETQKSIILLSDGQENTSPYISQMKQTLIDRNIRVYSVGLGDQADENTLRQVADDTNGEFFYADNAFKLPGIFATIYGNLRNDGFLKVVGGILNFVTQVNTVNDSLNILSPQVQSTTSSFHSETVEVDTSVGEATFLVTWDKGNGQVDIIDPNGNIITAQNADSFPDVAYNSGDGYAMFRVINIAAGDWTVNFIPDGTSDVQWELKVFAVDGEIQFEAETEKTSYVYPETVIIRAGCTAPQPVIGGNAVAFIVRPDGATVELELLDNGNPANADDYENDGIYSGKFSAFSSDGVYTVTAKFDSTGATTPAPSNTTGIEFAFDPCAPPIVPEPVEDFERYRQFTFSVSGVLNNQTPIADAGSDQTVYAWIDGIAEVDLDGSGSFDDDGDPLTYLWTWSIDGYDYQATGISPTIELPAGQHTVSLVVNDGIIDSEPSELYIAVVEPVEVDLAVSPRVLNFRSRSWKITAKMRFPWNITRNEIDSSEPILLYPGEIEAEWVKVRSSYNRRYKSWRITACILFNKNELIGLADENKTQIAVVGKLDTGQYFFGYYDLKTMYPNNELALYRKSWANYKWNRWLGKP